MSSKVNNEQKIPNEKELLQKLFLDVRTCKQDEIIFLGGHFPLIYSTSEAIEAIDYWGKFSKYTLELACKVACFAKEKGKKISFVFFVDDHVYETISGLNSSQLSTRRNKLFKLRSGGNAQLPKKYKEIMQKFGFSEKDIIRHDHEKNGRENCLYFSEKVLRASPLKIENACAREYITFLENKKYFSKDKNYMVAFIPQRCKESICRFTLDLEIKGLSSSHIFLDSMAILSTKKELYSSGIGVTYKKN